MNPLWRYALAAFVSLALLLWISSSTAPQVGTISTLAAKVQDGFGGIRFGQDVSSPYADSRFYGGGFVKPAGLRVVGIVFAGRREFISILDCYLRRNLVRNGGLLDEVIWVFRTENPSDLAWLNQAVNDVPEYTVHYPVKDKKADKFKKFQYTMVERGNMYIKFDDDILFFEDHAIEAVVKRKFEHPEYLLVSANVINQPAMSWVHYHLGAVKPYFPELTRPLDLDPNFTEEGSGWRASKLPRWDGPEDYHFSENDTAPFLNHRWLPVGPEIDIEQTPCGLLGEGAKDQYASQSVAWTNWGIAAQQHYSFFENLEKDELWRYKYDIWDYHYDRMSINMVAFWGDLLVDDPIPGWDEPWMAMVLPKRQKKHAVMDGTAVASHFGFHRQIYKLGFLNQTDLVYRYRSYADEFICNKPLGTPRPV